MDADRRFRLARDAHHLRQASLDRPGNLEGWQIARLLREATTSAEADEAERRLRKYQAMATLFRA